MHVHLLIKLILFIAVFFQMSAFANETPVKGAACFISDQHGRVLVVEEMLSGSLSLPGGYVNKAENPKEAAKRETFEETGIKVQVFDELKKIKNTAIFDCRADHGLQIFPINSKLALVPSWKAMHFNREVNAVYLITPSPKLLMNSRFPDQVSFYTEFLSKNHATAAINNDSFEFLTDSKIAMTAKLSLYFRSAIESFPIGLKNMMDSILKSVSWLGSINVYFVMLPFALAIAGIRGGAQFILVFILSTTLVTFSKILFQVPRPIQIFPEMLQSEVFAGYSFPSLHSTNAFAVWGILYLWFKHLGRSSIYLLLLPGILTCLSRLYLGANHFQDLAVGAVLGLLIANFSMFIIRIDYIIKPKLWGILSLLLLPLNIFYPQAYFLYAMVCSLCYFSILSVFDKTEIDLSSGFNKYTFIISSIGIAFSLVAYNGITYVTKSNVLILIAQSLCIALLTFWYAFLTPKATSEQ